MEKARRVTGGSVPSLWDSRSVLRLPGTDVPGFPVAPLRGWGRAVSGSLLLLAGRRSWVIRGHGTFPCFSVPKREELGYVPSVPRVFRPRVFPGEGMEPGTSPGFVGMRSIASCSCLVRGQP